MRRFLSAVSFLTRLPVLGQTKSDEADLAESPPLFPLAGALIGLSVAALDTVISVAFPSRITAVTDLAVAFLITGGLHLDGFLDTADGMLSGKSPEKTLEIMRDSRIGAMGVSAGILLLALKAACIGSLAWKARTAALVISPILGRNAMVFGMVAFPYARPAGGLGSLFKSRSRPAWAAWSCLLSAVLSLATIAVIATASRLPGMSVWPLRSALAAAAAFVSSILIALAVGGAATRRLGGLTGDVYGAICEIAEVAALAAFAARWPA